MGTNRDDFYYDKFPDTFKWGLATSSYQTEGAWNLDGKGENIWDRFCHAPQENIADKSSGDVACDSYHKYKQDVQLLKNIGAQMYRFSISWARILPNGRGNQVNEAGVHYYNKLIDELLSQGIEPVATIYHWDLPQVLQDEGGWLNEKLVTERFGELSRVCFEKFGDRVKRWITINEPFIVNWFAYEVGTFPPGLGEPGVSFYIAVQNMLKAHAVAYHIYQNEFKSNQNGLIGIALDSRWYEPADPDLKSDCAAAKRTRQFRLGLLAHPIFKGDYPEIVKECIANKSMAEGRSQSRLPVLDQIWIDKIKGSCDFLGINHYTTELTEEEIYSDTSVSAWKFDQNTKRYFDPSWPTTGVIWQRVVPFGLRRLLCFIKDEYGNPEVMVTENGVAGSSEETLQDTQRADFYRLYINEVLKAIKLDGCNVTGYFAWSLLGVHEWTAGYTLKFGVHHVDFNDPERKRTPKASAKALANIFKENGFSK